MDMFDDLLDMGYLAGECRPRVRQILETGGMAAWFDGKVTKCIAHFPALHRPLNRLPWPLSLLQPHLVEFRIYHGEDIGDAEPFHRHLYKKVEIPQAIEEFLRGSGPNHLVTFS